MRIQTDTLAIVLIGFFMLMIALTILSILRGPKKSELRSFSDESFKYWTEKIKKEKLSEMNPKTDTSLLVAMRKIKN
jgi:hypothetical protein